MSKTDYYEKRTEHKRVKSEIVSKYLLTWVNIIGPKSNELHYLDLFSGRGIYKDGLPATPLMIFNEIEKAAIKIPWILDKLHLSFFEGKKIYYDMLSMTLRQHPIYKLLKNEPIIIKQKIDTNFISNNSNLLRDRTYTFIDPFGYTDISLDLVDSVSKHWGCDCLFYLSISGLIRNIREPKKEESNRNFFGDLGFERLINSIENNTTSLSEIILTEIELILRTKNNYRVIKYGVEFGKMRRVSHFLVFISKHKLGYEKMRHIMIKQGYEDSSGYPILRFSETLKKKQSKAELKLGDRSKNLITYSNQLLEDFGQRVIKVESLLEECVEKEYPLANTHIKKLLRYLEVNDKVLISRLDMNGNPRAGERIQRHDIVSFIEGA